MLRASRNLRNIWANEGSACITRTIYVSADVSADLERRGGGHGGDGGHMRPDNRFKRLLSNEIAGG